MSKPPLLRVVLVSVVVIGGAATGRWIALDLRHDTDSPAEADADQQLPELAAAPDPTPPTLSNHIDDRAGLFKSADIPRFNLYLSDLRDESGVDIRFLFVDSVSGSLEDYARQQARALGIGRDIDGRGALLVYDVQRHALRIEVSSRLEPIFTDRFVGYLMRNHVRAFFAANDPALGLRLTMFMLHARLRRAALGEEYDPQAAEFIAVRERLAAGGGASARMPAPGEPAGFTNADADSAAQRYFKPQPTIDATYRRYLEWLRRERYLPDVRLFTPESRAYLAKLPMTPAFQEYMLFVEYGQPYAVVQRLGYAILYFTRDPLPSPHFFYHTPDGWQMDMRAEVDNTQNFIGPYTWALRRRNDPYSRIFWDQFVHIGPIMRMRGGDNRSVPTYKWGKWETVTTPDPDSAPVPR